ncbi:serpin B6-like isoform X3 [Macrosteles quadrilineatus]|uniref:serpin B6-like isoform X3 n=1 Tax=Macrosteles quadrilineatus TaxID=74068 RepID=UPI0023E1F6B7|nr:serpin B6-like isoform X3 [Macrosteles quadrilineatus]
MTHCRCSTVSLSSMVWVCLTQSQYSLKPQPVNIISAVTLLFVVSMMAAAFQPVQLSKEEKKALDTVSVGTNKFAISLFRALAKEQTGNVFVSPLSVQIVLALAYMGARGETAKELATLLSLPDDVEHTKAGYHSLIRVLQAPVLKLANRMFVEKTSGIKENFQKDAEKYFLSSAEALDFLLNHDKSRQHINSWVEEQTNQKIKNLLAPDVITSATRLVLVNAIHFKADWANKFNENDTKEEDFHLSKTKTVKVQMMHAKKKFYFSHDDELKAKILQLDYAGDNFRMIVILPDDIEGLSALEEKLETVNLSDKIRYMNKPTVTVALPKFKMEETMDLNEILKSLGARAMFDEKKVDFSGLSDQSLVVSNVVQKAFVEVNEKGTEAAAATGMVMMLTALPTKPPPDQEFIADHPFLFYITQLLYNTPLFLGRHIVPT